eukprot:TRINITY_DN8317_c0_g2_i1.p1 TRINITY_DN8317_c0_g2~~TRINITY_DN8317_c0_g2_i1.p1  ORF type:complete len:803 (+),score=228.60 TRINITY_DN8317_c0_g2_i1:70-2478(+)
MAKSKPGQSSKEKFQSWLKAKKDKARGDKASHGSKGKGKGKDQGKSKGKDRGHDAKQTKPEGAGHKAHASTSLIDMGESQGVSGDLVRKLMATKQRLLVGNAEAARAGAVRAEPGAWSAAHAQKVAEGSKGSEKGKKGKGKGGGEKGKQGKGKGGHWPQPEVPVVREELVALNRRIASLAQARDLQGIRATLQELEGKQWANGHTYAAAVNALCRCGDWKGAEAALGRAEKAGLFRRGAGASSGLITRTSMIRGYVECARDLGKAKALLERMESLALMAARPNVRTANTFLRGCLILGAVADAEALLKRMETRWAAEDEWRDAHGGAPDASSYEAVVFLLCQALRHADAFDLAKKAIANLGPSPGCASMFVATARAATICGEADVAAAAAKRARQLLDEAKFSSKEMSNVDGSGGKRGKRVDDPDAAARTRSLEVFQQHRRGELLAELQEVEGAVSSGSGKKRKRPAKIDLQSLWSKTLSFEDYGDSIGKKEKESLAEAMCRRLCAKFGLAEGSPEAQAAVSNFQAAISGDGAKSKKKKRRRAAGQDGASAPARLDLAALFPLTEAGPKPVCLELCSGTGDWLCAQARRDPSAAWVACELRFDRVARCFQRLALRGLASAEGNAGIIVGDARDALERRLAVGCCSKLFINHPEPPHQTDLEKATAAAEVSAREGVDSGTEASHLLTVSFLRDACGKVLKAGGILTVCTDNLEYGKWLLQAFASPPLSELFEDALQGQADKAARVARKGKVCLRTDPPPSEICGACYSGEDGGSYFQRLKKSEKGSRWQEDYRYFLCLRRRKP